MDERWEEQGHVRSLVLYYIDNVCSLHQLNLYIYHVWLTDQSDVLVDNLTIGEALLPDSASRAVLILHQ